MGLSPVESNAVSIVQIPVELDNPIPISEPAPPPPPQPMIHNELTVPSITISPPSPEATSEMTLPTSSASAVETADQVPHADEPAVPSPIVAVDMSSFVIHVSQSFADSYRDSVYADDDSDSELEDDEYDMEPVEILPYGYQAPPPHPNPTLEVPEASPAPSSDTASVPVEEVVVAAEPPALSVVPVDVITQVFDKDVEEEESQVPKVEVPPPTTPPPTVSAPPPPTVSSPPLPPTPSSPLPPSDDTMEPSQPASSPSGSRPARYILRSGPTPPTSTVTGGPRLKDPKLERALADIELEEALEAKEEAARKKKASSKMRHVGYVKSSNTLFIDILSILGQEP